MKKLNLKISSSLNVDSCVLIDGKNIKTKKDNFGNQMTTIETENDEIEVTVFDWNEMKSKLWFVTSILFYIISLFGLFDIRHDKRCRSIDFKFKVKVDKEENEMKMIYNKFEENGLAVNFESDCEVKVMSNRYYIDEKVKKKFKIMKWVKITILVLAIIILILVLK